MCRAFVKVILVIWVEFCVMGVRKERACHYPYISKKGGGLLLFPQFLWTSLCVILHSSLITNVKENCVEYNDGEDDADDNYIKTMMVMAIT